MPRRISTSILGGPVLGTFTAQGNRLQTIVTNEDIILDPNGTGEIKADKHLMLNSNKQLKLADADSSNFIALAAPTTIANDITYTFPGSGVSAGYFLQTNASGVLSWAEANVTITNSTTSGSTFYPSLTTSTSGIITGLTVSNTKLSFVPSTGTLTATAFSGNLTSSSVTITGGTINNTTIGATTATTGRFTTITETSSIALKENVKPIENALDLINSLSGKIYDRKDGSSKNEAGLIAEDVYKVIPNLVNVDNDGNPDSIQYSKLTAYLIEAIKELTDIIKNR